MLNSKKQFINVSKYKLNIGKYKLKIIIISFFDNLNKKNKLLLIPKSILNKNIIKTIIISTNIYYIAYKLKKAQVFIIFIRNPEF